MRPADAYMEPVISPAASMASWSFYLGLFGFIATVVGALLTGIAPLFSTIVMAGGLALGVIAIVLGVVGLFSSNRASALAGALFGILAVIAFFVMPGWVR